MQVNPKAVYVSRWMKYILFAAAIMTVLAIAACGSSAEPGDEEPAATEDTSASQSTESADTETASDASAAEPEGDVAPKFELPSGLGGTVSLASFAGDKNVVVVFYRGFW